MEGLEMTMEQWEREWTWEGLPVLKCRCSLPHFPGNGRAQRRMERFWRGREVLLLKWLGEYHRRCCCRAEQALSASRPIRCDSVTVEAEAVVVGQELISLLLRLQVPGLVRCWPELWNWRQGVPVQCKTLLPPLKRLRWGRGRLLLTEYGIARLSAEGTRQMIHSFGGECGENSCAIHSEQV